MEIWQLRTFCEIAETLNFTKASENLHLTQSAVSHQIKALEDELGVRLFIRGKRGVKLTDAGESALEHALRILGEADHLRMSVSERETSIIGRVRVAAATQALVHLFAPLFEQFMDLHTQVDLLFRTTPSTEQTVEDILNGLVDVGFASLPVYSPNLQIEELFEDELLITVSPDHPFAGKGNITVKEAEKERWILFERGASIRRATDSFFESVRFDPETALESNDVDFIKLMIEHGRGISLLPAWTIADNVRRGKLCSLGIKGKKLRRSVAMVSLKGNLSAPIREFTSFISERADRIADLAAGIGDP